MKRSPTSSPFPPCTRTAGSLQRHHHGMHDYVVMLKPEEGAVFGRIAVTAANLAKGERFRHALQKVVGDENLAGEIDLIGRAMRLPFVAVVGTVRAADRIREMPDVEDVVEDSSMFGLIR